jgi:hypothetical protein
MDIFSIGATIVGGHLLSEILNKKSTEPAEAGASGQVGELIEPEQQRLPFGPIALDAGIGADWEIAVWNAYRDVTDGAEERLSEFSAALEADGMPLASGVLRARALEIHRMKEALKARSQVVAAAEAAATNAPSKPPTIPAPPAEEEPVAAAPVKVKSRRAAKVKLETAPAVDVDLGELAAVPTTANGSARPHA